jgi:hypothetical protein
MSVSISESLTNLFKGGKSADELLKSKRKGISNLV